MKKLLQTISFIVILSLIVLVFSGCAVLYSAQKYGPDRSIGLISPGKSTIAELIKGYGSPDAVYKSGNSDIYIFKSREGRSFLGIYSDVKMNDIVVIASQGVVQEVYETPKGSGITIIGAMMMPICTVGNAH